MRMYAISDLHVGYEQNRNLLHSVSPHLDDWLILGGDLGETQEHLRIVFSALRSKFKKLVWVPGNHELWADENSPSGSRGQLKYEKLISVCREYDVLTPEDPYPIVESEQKKYLVVPTFILYDYSFAPDDVRVEDAVAWAGEEDLHCADEVYLLPDPFPTRQAWCHHRAELTLQRLKGLPKDIPIVLINHFPLRRDLLKIFFIPRFSIWCGTRKTENWHKDFNIHVVVSGHQHVRYTEFRDGVRFEEVSLGYPRQWNQAKNLESYFRLILPDP